MFSIEVGYGGERFSFEFETERARDFFMVSLPLQLRDFDHILYLDFCDYKNYDGDRRSALENLNKLKDNAIEDSGTWKNLGER